MLTTHRLGRLAGVGALSTLLLLAACEQSSDSPTGLQPPGLAENAALEGQVEAATIHVCQSLTQGGPETGEYELDVDGAITTFQITGDAPFLFDGIWNYVDVDGAGCTEIADQTGGVAKVSVTNAVSIAATGNRLATTDTWTFHGFMSPGFDPDGGAVLWFKPLLEEPQGGLEGCTPGYWRQEHHYDSWVGYAPTDYFDDVFGAGPHIPLGDAVKANGGGENALMRHAVAALLNASSPDVDYPYSVGDVIALVQEAFFTGEFEDIKDDFDEANNLGCPLN